MHLKRMLISLTVICAILLIAFLTTSKQTPTKNTVTTTDSMHAQTSNDTDSTETLQDKIHTYLQQQQIDEADISIAIHDLTTAEEYRYQSDTYFVAASLYKLPLAMLYYEKLAEGSIHGYDTLLYTANCYEEGGPIGYTYRVGDTITIETLLYDMIVYSDNTAGHILYENLSGWNAFRDEIKKYSSIPYTEAFYENMFTTAYLNDVLFYLTENSDLYASLIEDMMLVYPDDYLAGELDEVIAQKYGSYDTAENAAGIVYGEHPYTIAILTRVGSNGSSVIADINKIVATYLAEK